MTNMHSPLQHIKVPASVAAAGIVMREDKYRGHLNLRGNPQDEAFTSAVEKTLGVALPTAPNSVLKMVLLGFTGCAQMSGCYWLLKARKAK